MKRQNAKKIFEKAPVAREIKVRGIRDPYASKKTIEN